MSKILTFHDKSNGEGWFEYESYKKTQIDAIKDPEGERGEKPTSIPTPFAQMDLMLSAFEQITGNKNINDLDGITTNHQLVSEFLDVAQIFFNINKLRNKIEIITWDKNKDLKTLLDSSETGHKRLGSVIKLFLDQDKESFHFDSLDRLYLLNYKGGPDEINIIGGTSSLTLFFSTSNKISDFMKIQFGNDTLFDSDFTPLFKRDKCFHKYLMALTKQIPNFASKFASIYDYIDLSTKKRHSIKKSEAEEIRNVNSDIYFNESGLFEEMNTGIDGDLVEIHGYYLKALKIDSVKELKSDFTIDSSKYSGRKPLVLPNSTYNKTYRYVTDPWQKDYKAQYFDPEIDINKRQLPHQDEIYPYLTVSDLLEDYIMQLPYPLNKKHYFDGNLKDETGENEISFVLPIKNKFFEFFDIKDLKKRTLYDGKKMIELIYSSGGAVKTILRIPIVANDKKEYITFERIYYPSVAASQIVDPEPKENKGSLITPSIAIGIFPAVKFPKNIKPYYRVGLMDNDTPKRDKVYASFDYELDFMLESGESSDYTFKGKRYDKRIDVQPSSNYYLCEDDFDYIVVKHNFAKGLIIPTLTEVSNFNNNFSFAVDFGTTNTHIEMQKGADPESFNYSESETQVAYSFDLKDEKKLNYYLALHGNNDLKDNFLLDFTPFSISKDLKVKKKISDYKFPQRTAIASSSYTDYETSKSEILTLTQLNIPFLYEKRTISANISTNLKWSKYTTENSTDKEKVKSFIDQLLLMIRAKVIMNNGNLENTKIYWFYPTSMMESRLNKLDKIWSDAYNRYFGVSTNLKRYPESLAPFYYYAKKQRVNSAHRPTISIDIGGGTSDVVVFHKNIPQFMSSFRFAANSIFGDGYNGAPQNNGFIIKYGEKLENKFNSNKLLSLDSVYNQIKNRNNSDDIIAFYFSLDENKEIIEKNIPISFSDLLLDDDDFKIVFLTFYSSLVYHIAQMMKMKKLDMPMFITLSGTGSKVVRFIDSSADFKHLGNFAKLIFEKVYEKEFDYDLIVKQEEEPKPVTCKGGLLAKESKIDVDIDEIKSVLIGRAKRETNEENIKLAESKLKYSELTTEILEEIEQEAKKFIDIFFALNDKYNFTNKFGVDGTKLSEYKRILTKDLMTYIEAGKDRKLEEQNEEDAYIEETLFFYPIIGALNQLSYQIGLGGL